MDRKRQRNAEDDGAASEPHHRMGLPSTDVVSHVLGYCCNQLLEASAGIASLRVVSRLWCTAFGQYMELSVVPRCTERDDAGRPTWTPASNAELLLLLLHLDDGVTRTLATTFLYGLRLPRLPPRAIVEGLVTPRALLAVRYLELVVVSRLPGQHLAPLLQWFRNLVEVNVGGALDGTDLAVFPHGMSTLNTLKKLWMHGNGLHALPEEWDFFRAIPALEWLDISANQLVDLPSEMCALRKLKRLDIEGNRLQELPGIIAALKPLESLNISENQLTNIYNVRYLTNLELLFVKGNLLRELPRWIGELTALEVFDTSNNQLAAVSDGMRTLRNLKKLWIGANRFQALPDWIGELTALEVFDTSNNQLSALPAGMRTLKNLKELGVGANRLRTLPDWIGELTALEVFNISSNQLATLPDGVRRLKNLKYLGIQSIGLQALPDWIGELTALEVFDTRYNQLPILPDGMRTLKNLKTLWVEANRLGTLPCWIGELTALELLNTSSHRFTVLPDGIRYGTEWLTRSRVPPLLPRGYYHSSLISLLPLSVQCRANRLQRKDLFPIGHCILSQP